MYLHKYGVGGLLVLVIRRSHFVSICLLALASSIALTEYIMYSPVVSDVSDDGNVLFLDNDSKLLSNNNDDQTGSESEDSIVKNFESDSDVKTMDTPGTDTTQIPLADEQVTVDDKTIDITLTLDSGDTIASLLTRAGFKKSDIYSATAELSKVVNIRSLKIGQEITVKGSREAGETHLDSFELKPDPRYRVVVSKTQNGKFKAEKIEIPIKKVVKTASGVMSAKDPVGTIVACGVKRSIATEAVRTLEQLINMRSSKEPMNFEFLYRDFYDNEGNIVTKPELLYASALINGKIFRVYKFQYKGSAEYVDSNGVTLKSMVKSRSMLNKPLNSMKITSGYGSRVHPVHGVYKRHTGVDLKASIGTPIYAAADGKVLKACYYSGYGKYVRIKHAGEVDTAYGHLSRMIVRPGQRVRQGQVIGYVGVTGVTTGPHLHYEVMKNGKFINPISVVKQAPQKLNGQKLSKFNQFKKEVNLQVVGLTPNIGKKASKIKKFS